jgi:hypothetical protein
VRQLILNHQSIFAFLVASIRDEKLAAKAGLVLKHLIHSKDAALHEDKMQVVLTSTMDLLVGDDKGRLLFFALC